MHLHFMSDTIINHINPEELAALALTLANTNSPQGHEAPMADAVFQWLAENKLNPIKQPILPDRANVYAVLKGTGGGASLIFNSHLDSEISGPEWDWGMMAPDINKIGAWREGDRLFGHTVLNDRGLMATTMITLKALRDAGVPLKGDVIFTGVAGETGSAPVDEFQGLNYEGKGIGSRMLVAHGVRADYALIAETTDFGISWLACGACYFKVSVPGRNMYTPRSVRPDDVRQHPNAIVKMARVIEAIENWARQYEAANTYDSACGRVVPKVVIGAIRGGVPYRPNRTSTHCAVFVDVRIVPGADPLKVQRELEAAAATAEVGARVEMFLARTGIEGRNVEPLNEAVRRFHREMHGAEAPTHAPVEVCSMWRDNNVFNSVGIPALTYGPPRRVEEGGTRAYLSIHDLAATAAVYAQVAQTICNRPV